MVATIREFEILSSFLFYYIFFASFTSTTPISLRSIEHILGQYVSLTFPTSPQSLTSGSNLIYISNILYYFIKFPTPHLPRFCSVFPSILITEFQHFQSMYQARSQVKIYHFYSFTVGLVLVFSSTSSI